MQKYFQRVEQTLKMRRLQKGDLAAYLDVALSTVSRWKTSIPRAETVQATAEFLGVDAKWLMTGEGKKKPESEATANPEVSTCETKVKDDPVDFGRKFGIEERLERLEADNAELREDVARLYELLADRIRKGGAH